MNRMLYSALLILCFTAGFENNGVLGKGTADSGETKTTTSTCTILSAEFGIVQNQVNFIKTTTVPYIENQSYGWRIRVAPPEARVHWREEFELPRTPAIWEGNPDDAVHQTLKDHDKICVTEKDDKAVGGVIQNFWAVAKDDPHGLYHMRVFVNGKLAKTFDFTVH